MEDEDETGFEAIGLEPRLVRAIAKRGLSKPTPIQLKGIPLVLEGKDVVARAKTGSGKTLAYLLPMVQRLLAVEAAGSAGLGALVLVPTRELCQQVHDEFGALLNHCGGDLRGLQLTTSMSTAALKAALARKPHVIISTPGCIATCITENLLPASELQQSLSMLVLDEADLLLSYGYEEDLHKLAAHVPRRCQCLLMSATTSEDVEKLKKLVLHNPVTLTLTEAEGPSNDSLVPSAVEQFKIVCSSQDKLLYLLTVLRFGLVHSKALIFVNAIDTSFRIKLFLEQFGIKSAVLNAELPQNSRLHILKEFNLGLFDYMIATDDGKLDKNAERTQGKKKLKRKLADAEFGVVRGIDFKNVRTVVNYDMPRTVSGYIHRIGRTGRAGNAGVGLSLVTEKDGEVLSAIEEFLAGDDKETETILSFPKPVKEAAESLRYRAEDVARGVTKIAIREARAKELKLEIMNSERLKAHFEDNPADLELLKHDKILSKQVPSHLRTLPEYLRDPAVEAAGIAMKAAKVAMSKPRTSYMKRRTRSWEEDPVKAIGSRKRGRDDRWSKKSSSGKHGKGHRRAKA